jgi:O-antigen ligase
MEEWDQRLGASNLYLQLLADMGIFSLISFCWLALALVKRLARPPHGRGSSSKSEIRTLGLLAALAALLAHGLLDYFFEFHAIYLLFWSLAGLIALPDQSEIG